VGPRILRKLYEHSKEPSASIKFIAHGSFGMLCVTFTTDVLITRWRRFRSRSRIYFITATHIVTKNIKYTNTKIAYLGFNFGGGVGYFEK